MKLVKSLVLVVAAGLIIAACGGTSTPSDVVQKVLKAQTSLDFGTVKKHVVKDLVPQIEEAEKAFETPEVKEAMERLKAAADQVKYDVVKEEIDGDNAKVTVKITALGQEQEQELIIPLVKEDGAWKVSKLD
ncbi:MAG: DUF4878 domain-containing protein [Prevotellaceae bacterium]|jgi:hypothetical protein|nr:DUF4878 domain-containing protein [Prevotellaceae bacterium]